MDQVGQEEQSRRDPSKDASTPQLSLAQERPTWFISASPQLTGMWYMNRLHPGGPDLFCCAPPPPIPTIPVKQSNKIMLL